FDNIYYMCGFISNVINKSYSSVMKKMNTSESKDLLKNTNSLHAFKQLYRSLESSQSIKEKTLKEEEVIRYATPKELYRSLESSQSTKEKTLKEEKVIRYATPKDYLLSICMMLASIYLMLTSFFPLLYNITDEFDPINFLMNLFYFLLGIATLLGAIMLLKKSDYIEKIADETFDEIIYQRLKPVLKDVAVVQVGLNNVQSRLDMINLNIENISKRKESSNHKAAPNTSHIYIKYILLVNITLAVFLFMLKYPLSYVPYSVTMIYIMWWTVITAEYKLWKEDMAWAWVFIPILILPVYTIIMDAYLLDYQMFGSLFIGLTVYVFAYYSWCAYLVRRVLPLDLHIAIKEFKEKIEELPEKKVLKKEKDKPIISMPSIFQAKIKVKLRLNPFKTGITLVIVSIVFFALAWFGYAIQHNIIPNISWNSFGLSNFNWTSIYSYTLTMIGMVALGIGSVLMFKRVSNEQVS
ncbi:MAG: hypothetical protein ACE5KE_13185, partial [Methanosarcinales archaeon]